MIIVFYECVDGEMVPIHRMSSDGLTNLVKGQKVIFDAGWKSPVYPAEQCPVGSYEVVDVVVVLEGKRGNVAYVRLSPWLTPGATKNLVDQLDATYLETV